MDKAAKAEMDRILSTLTEDSNPGVADLCRACWEAGWQLGDSNGRAEMLRMAEAIQSMPLGGQP